MSHVAEVQVEFRDLDCLEIACKALGAEFHRHAKCKLYDGVQREGTLVKPKGWLYPVCVKGNKAEFDNFNGSWGKMSEFDKIKQLYAVEAATKQAKRQGYQTTRQVQKDGSIKVTLTK